MQKDEMRSRRYTKRGATTNSSLKGPKSSSLPSSSGDHTIRSDKKKEEDEIHLAAARGLRCLMNAAAAAI